MKYRVLPAFFLLAALSGGALASNNNYGPFPANYAEECGGSCHVPFPPQLLTAEGWQQIMAQLGKHFGVDASLEPKQRAAITDFLDRNSSTRGERHAPTEASGRMSRTAWFVRKHGTTPPPKGSLADCAACHPAADKGGYAERDIRLPAGWTHREGSEYRSWGRKEKNHRERDH